jgi:hypothetical protein
MMPSDSPTISPAIATPTTASSRRDSINSVTEEEPPVKMLETINPMIFVPLEDTLFKPLTTPRDKVERLGLGAQRTERYARSMDEIVWHSFRLERDRVYQKLRSASRNEKQQSPRPSGILPQEVEMMVHNLSAPSVPGTDFSLRREPPNRSSMQWAERPHDHAVEELSGMVLSGALPSFAFVEEHRQKTTGEYRQAIEREKAAEARIGMTGGGGGGSGAN